MFQLKVSVTHSSYSGEQALSAAVSPGNRATFGFSRKQKKIPAALKEVTDALPGSDDLWGIMHDI